MSRWEADCNVQGQQTDQAPIAVEYQHERMGTRCRGSENIPQGITAPPSLRVVVALLFLITYKS